MNTTRPAVAFVLSHTKPIAWTPDNEPVRLCVMLVQVVDFYPKQEAARDPQ